jgi:hypothetical protein
MLELYDDDMSVLGSSFVEHDENFLFFKFCLTCVVAHQFRTDVSFVCVFPRKKIVCRGYYLSFLVS